MKDFSHFSELEMETLDVKVVKQKFPILISPGYCYTVDTKTFLKALVMLWKMTDLEI